jgi:sigma-B regulation protein RsbU (phosphoserine phosphatase)
MKRAKSVWSAIPRKSLAVFLAGVFFIFSTIGFANDIIEMGASRRCALGWRSCSRCIRYLLCGYRICASQPVLEDVLPIFAVQFVLLDRLGHWFPDLPQPTQMNAADIAGLQGRLRLSGIAPILVIGLGYACFVYVAITEGRRYFRVHAEMALATEIHHVLVPAIDTTIANFDFYGRSLPSGEVGGDLIDVFQNGRGWIAYIADVSGHGVAPGVIMGMVKSAARMQLSSAEESAVPFERLNTILVPIKKPEMFVTFAYLPWNGERLEYSLAGHPPIFDYHAATREISEVACSNLPLGIFGGQQFVSGSVPCAPDDRFLLHTDGLLEVVNAQDEEFGLAGVKAVLSTHAGGPPGTTLQAVLDAIKRHGQATDDQSMLLVQCHLRAA